MRLQLLGTLDAKGAYKKAMTDAQQYIDMFNPMNQWWDPNAIAVMDSDIKLDKKKNFLYVDESNFQRYYFVEFGDGFYLYKVLPNVTNSSLFEWKEQHCYNTSRMGIKFGLSLKKQVGFLRFCVHYYLADDRAQITVYAGGSGWSEYGSDRMFIDEADNDKILEEINFYIRRYKDEADKMEILKEEGEKDA